MKSITIGMVVAVTATVLFAACGENNSTETAKTDSVAVAPADGMVTTTTTTTTTTRAPLSETENYVDLKTGKKIRIKLDPATNRYTTADMAPLDIFVSEMSHDTFWGGEAVPVNNAIIRNDAGAYAVDEMRVKANGEGYKAKSEYGDAKVKENENELKIKDGETKVKINDNEAKMKDEDVKIKTNSKETKIKTKDSKTEINNRTGEEKTKAR